MDAIETTRNKFVLRRPTGKAWPFALLNRMGQKSLKAMCRIVYFLATQLQITSPANVTQFVQSRAFSSGAVVMIDHLGV